MIPKVTANRRNRSAKDPSNSPRGTDAVATVTIAATKMQVDFDQPAVVNGDFASWKVGGISPTAVTVNSATRVTLTFLANVVAGQTWVIPNKSSYVRTRTGGYVAAAAGTF